MTLPASVEELHEIAAGLPFVTVEHGSGDNPVYQVGAKSFVFFRTPRPDAVDPETGEVEELAGDVLVLAIPPAGTADSDLTGRLIVAGVTPDRAHVVSAATLLEFLTVAYAR